MARRQISLGRKAIYYIGGAIVLVGGLMFGSMFVAGPLAMIGVIPDALVGASFVVGFIGFGFIFAGVVLMGIGRAGLAGSGIILDPEQARDDVEPWSRMTGGLIKDAADEAGIQLGRLGTAPDADDSLPFDEKLRRLHKLYEDGILSEDEYEQQKSKILEGTP